MNMQKFYAGTTREALRKVRDLLGENALILSSKSVSGGVEIIAVAEAEVEAVATPAFDVRSSSRVDTVADVLARGSKKGNAVTGKADAHGVFSPNDSVNSTPVFRSLSEKVNQTYHQVARYAEDAGLADDIQDKPEIRFFGQTAAKDAQKSVRPAPYPLNAATVSKPSKDVASAGVDTVSTSAFLAAKATLQSDVVQAKTSHASHGASLNSEPAAQGAQPVVDWLRQQKWQNAAQTKGVDLEDIPVATKQTAPAFERSAQDRATTSNFTGRPLAETVVPQGAAPTSWLDGEQSAGISLPVAQQIGQEIWSLRTLLEGQLAGMAWQETTRRDPQRALLLRTLLGAGFSPQLSRVWLDMVPNATELSAAIKQVKQVLQKQLICLGPQEDIVDQGGVYALIGPTGVGKTTTVAKLAARCTLKYGPQRVALITTDSYRIGAHDQLKIYGRILGIPVYAVSNEEELNLTLSDLANRSLILIDTVGMGQRDRRLVEQTAILGGRDGMVRQILLVNANAQAATLEDVLRVYSAQSLTGCILTKVDEAVQLGSVLDTMVRYDLPLYYVTNGQRVPEDLHLANSLYLIDRAFRSSPIDSPWALLEDEYPLQWSLERANAGLERNAIHGGGSL